MEFMSHGLCVSFRAIDLRHLLIGAKVCKTVLLYLNICRLLLNSLGIVARSPRFTPFVAHLHPLSHRSIFLMTRRLCLSHLFSVYQPILSFAKHKQ
jgi:hypothetical protein